MSAAKARSRRRRAGAGALVDNFYDSSVPEGDRVALAIARQVQGVDQEIAVLRVRLRRALEEHPENLPLMLKGIEMLVKALSARYRLSKEAKADISASIEGVLRDIGGRVYPEGFDDVAGNEDD